MRAPNTQEAFITLAALGVAALVVILTNVALSSGNIRHCYLNSGTTSAQFPVTPTRYWTVIGFRPWRSDTTVGHASSIDEAVEIANKAGCPLHAEK